MMRLGFAVLLTALLLLSACSEQEAPGAPTAPIPEAPMAAAPFVHGAQPVSAAADDRGGQPRVHNAAPVLPPTPVTPAEGATIDGLRPTFRVNNPTATGFDGTMFIELQIARNRRFRPVDITVSLRAHSRGNTDLRPARDLKAGTWYYWRARGFTSGHGSSDWSAVRRFRTRTVEGGVPPDRSYHPHLHEGLDGHFHRTMIYGDGFRLWNPDTEEWDADCENDRTYHFRDGDARCIDHRFWYSTVDEAPERLRVVVDVTEVHEVAGERSDGHPVYKPSRRCRISDLRYAGGGRYLGGERFSPFGLADDTPRLIREATGRPWQGGPVHYRRPGAYLHPETVVVRFVHRGCDGRPDVGACATYGSGGLQEWVVDDNCQLGFWNHTLAREAFAHELGHTLGFRHPDTRDRQDEMCGVPYCPRNHRSDGHAGYSEREQRHMRHAFAHGRGYRGVDGLHLEGPRRPRRLEWVYD